MQWVDGLRRYLSVAVVDCWVEMVWELDGEAGPVFFKGGGCGGCAVGLRCFYDLVSDMDF